MNDTYISITGMQHYHGSQPFSVGGKLCCTKEPDNPADDEAIAVSLQPFGKVGYVANSIYTRAAGTRSAGRIYDSVPDTFSVTVACVTSTTVIAKVKE